MYMYMYICIYVYSIYRFPCRNNLRTSHLISYVAIRQGSAVI